MLDEAPSAAGRHRRRLIIVLCLTASYMVVEIIGGVITNSLALIADAAHMGTDVFGLALAVFAVWIGNRPATPQRTFGYYRAEILASVANAALLFAVAGYILFEAWRRFQEPPEVHSLPMLAVAAVGLTVNVIGAVLLHGGAEESLNVQGAFLEVVSDLLGSAGVIVAGLIIFFTGWWYADPLFSVLIGLFILPRTWRLLREAVGILLEGTPAHLSLPDVRAAIAAVPGVASVHDLHAWTITSGYVALSAHVQTTGSATSGDLLRQINAVLQEQFEIQHTTLQIEPPGYEETAVHP